MRELLNRKFIDAAFILSGTIIGVGIFGIPYSFIRAGFWLGIIELFILSAVVLLFHRLYGEIVLETSTFHRLPGYVRMYLGSRAATLSWLSSIFGISGALLAYVILGVLFSNNILGFWGLNLDPILLAAIMVATGALINKLPFREEALINTVFTAILIAFIFILGIFLLPHARFENFSGFNLKDIFFPYGVLLFALSGGVVIPDLITFLGRDKKMVYAAITAGSLLPAVLYLFFAVSVVGALGSYVSEEVIDSLQYVLGGRALLLGSAIGLLAAFTSFVLLSGSFRALLTLDLGLSNFYAWIIISALPLIFYILGLHNFILVISLIGAVSVGIDSGTIIASYHVLQKQKGSGFLWRTYLWEGGLYLMILAGVMYAIFGMIRQ